MKTLSQAEFDAIQARRVNAIHKLMAEIANTVDNNPSLITAERWEKIQDFIGTSITNMGNVVEAAMSRPTVVTLGEFSLGVPEAKKPRKPRTPKGGAVSTQTAGDQGAIVMPLVTGAHLVNVASDNGVTEPSCNAPMVDADGVNPDHSSNVDLGADDIEALLADAA